MPIAYEALNRYQFLETTEAVTVGNVGRMLTKLLGKQGNYQWYLVVRLSTPGLAVVPRPDGGFMSVETPPPGYAVVLPILEFSEAEAQHGKALLDTRLGDVPELLLPALTIERQLMGTGRARRNWVPVSPRRRVLVLDQGEIVGVLTDELRSGGFGGAMNRLFGKQQQQYNITKGQFTYRCPLCPAGSNTYDVSELIIDLASEWPTCPAGHTIKE